jgi:3-hydroxybutyryl-CoA dehydratase
VKTAMLPCCLPAIVPLASRIAGPEDAVCRSFCPAAASVESARQRQMMRMTSGSFKFGTIRNWKSNRDNNNHLLSYCPVTYNGGHGPVTDPRDRVARSGHPNYENRSAQSKELELNTVSAVGDSFTYPFTITQEQIVSFARITGDINPIHLDPAAASAAGFDGCIAHGVLILGVFSEIFGTILHSDGQVVLGIDARFFSPVRPHLPYTAIVTVAEMLPEKSQVVYQLEMFAEDGKQVLRGSCRLLTRKLYPPENPALA